jgi:uncharacterized membrane protein YfcA
MSGALVGFSLGLIGGGGSILAPPLLLYLVGITQPHVAIGTSALAVSINAYVNFLGYARAGAVRWRSAIVFALAGSLGALVGSSLGKAYNADRLVFLFGIVMLIAGAVMLHPSRYSNKLSTSAAHPSLTLQIAVSCLVGLASGFFGIGGGFLIVPGLVFATGMPIANAISSSLLAVGTFAMTTAINYATSGLVDWQVAAEFIGGGVLGGLGGMKLAAHLANYKGALNAVFATLIFIVAAYVLYRSGHAVFT